MDNSVISFQTGLTITPAAFTVSRNVSLDDSSFKAMEHSQ
jgi:hypothetical protein